MELRYKNESVDRRGPTGNENPAVPLSEPALERPVEIRSNIRRYLKPLAGFGVLLLISVGGALYLVNRLDPAAPAVQNEYNGPISIGMNPWPGNMGLYIADQKGYFKELGLDVILKNYSSLLVSEQDYIGGKTQGISTLNLDALQMARDGLEHKIIIAQDRSTGADAIIASPSVKSILDLKGKKVAYEQGTLEEFFLRYTLEQYKLVLSDVIPVDLDPEQAAQAYLRGEVAAAVTYEPYLSAAVAKGAQIIYSSKEAPNLIYDLMAFRSDFIDKYPRSVSKFTQAYFKGVRYWQGHQKEGNEITAKIIDDTPENVANQLKGLQILDQSDNVAAFTFSAGLDSLYGNLRELSVALPPSSGTKPYPSDTLIEPRFIRELNE